MERIVEETQRSERGRKKERGDELKMCNFRGNGKNQQRNVEKRKRKKGRVTKWIKNV